MGPEGRSTYWRRRVVVLVVLVALVAGVVWGVTALVGGGEEDPAVTRLDPTATSPTVNAGGSPSTPASPDASPSEAASPSGSASESASATAGAACPADGLTSAVSTTASNYGPQAVPQLVLSVVNAGAAPCTVEIGAGNVTFTVADSSGARVWSNVDCQTSSRIAEVTLQAKGSDDDDTSARVNWPRTRSAAGCPSNLADVPPGEYTVSVTRAGVEAGRATFSIAGS